MKQYFYITICLLIAGITNVIAQSADQNYIKTTTYLDAAGATSLKSVQYFDGLGRPVQTVQQNVGPSNNNQDLITVQEYDAFGRMSKAWLPVYRTSNTGTYYTGTIATDTKNQYANDTCAYSKSVYEASPLNRVVQQFGTGQAWRTASRPVKTEYLANTAADNCIYYYMDGDVLTKNATNYVASALYVVKTTDEDNKVSYEFKDKLGRVILQRQVNEGVNHDTYYVYDDFGNLRWVLPPMFESQSNMSTGCAYYGYNYKYDERNRCIEKKLPGIDPIYYVYDKADRLIFSQDGEQRTTTSWTFYKYDAFDRMILTGVWKNSGQTQASLKSKLGSMLATETFSTTGAYNYTWSCYNGSDLANVLNGNMVLQANYYDNYDFKTNSADFASTNYNQNLGLPTDFENKIYGAVGDNIKSKGLQTGSISVMLDGSNIKINSIFYYDYRSRMIQSITSNHLNGYEKEYINYTFTGNPSWKQSIHTAVLKGVPNTITETYTYGYDHANRPTTTKYKLNTDPDFITLSTLAYDDKGRLASKQQYGNAITTTYSYNIRNWLTSIKSTPFDETIYYNDSYAGNTPQYNGNISAVSWRSLPSNSLQGYRYTYDGLNRLKKGQYLSGTTPSDDFTEEVTQYDKNGNIKTMNRYARTSPANNTGIKVDDLTFLFGNGNQLTDIIDAIPANISPIGFVKPNFTLSMAPFGYNKNGAIKYKFYDGIAGITYNILNLPEKISFLYGHTTQYSYDASGVKHKAVYQIVKSNLNIPLGTTTYTPSTTDIQSTLTTDYCANGHIVYENGVLKRILNPEGYAIKYSNGTYSYYFYAKDHLGNNRTVSAVQIPVPGVTAYAGPQQETSYYPFGMPFAIVNAPRDGCSPELQPYKFGGKEYDEMHGLNWYDFGARYYSGIAPMFMTPDPLAEKYYSISPYAYCLNNPVRYVDPKGKDVWDVLLGVVHSVGDNLSLGAANTSTRGLVSNASDYNTGRDLGDAISMVAGAYEFVQGAAAAVAGVVAAPETAGASLAVTAEGTAVAGHGVAMSIKATTNLSSQNGRISQAEATRGSGKGSNHLKPNPNAEGDHSTFKKSPDGTTTNTATYKQNPKNPSGFDEVKRVDVKGGPHKNKSGQEVSTPHVHEKGQEVRPARPDELPIR